MAWSIAGRNARADQVAALIDEVSLHTGDPGQSGTTGEWTGGGYTRISPTYNPATDGIATLVSPLDFAGPPLTEAAYFGLWNGTTFLGAVPRGAGDAASNAAGEYSITRLDIDAESIISS